jgi:aspartyl-tRNA(Asn)/glutamyl-tRNA(Gln) amidotransferase subunit A
LVPAAARRQLVQLSSRGPVAGITQDIARALDQVAGEHPADPSSIPKPLHQFEERMQVEVARMVRGQARALKAVWSSTLGFGWCDPEVEAIARSAARSLVDAAGMVEVERSVDLPAADSGWLSLWALNSYAELRDFWPLVKEEMTPVVAAVFEAGERLGPGDLADAADQRLQLLQSVNAVLEQVDVILTPTMPSPAFPAEGPMPGRGGATDTEMGVDPMSGVCFTYPFNLTGHPAISVPAGFDLRGVPVGLQIVGPRFSDHRLLALARCMEQTNPWPRVPPPYT